MSVDYETGVIDLLSAVESPSFKEGRVTFRLFSDDVLDRGTFALTVRSTASDQSFYGSSRNRAPYPWTVVHNNLPRKQLADYSLINIYGSPPDRQAAEALDLTARATYSDLLFYGGSLSLGSVISRVPRIVGELTRVEMQIGDGDYVAVLPQTPTYTDR